jgi:arsenate reductase
MTVAFTCVENSCRSQMAEAMAKKMFPNQGIEFVSAGTHPADKVDADTLEILEEQGIKWKGGPKSFEEIGKPDILITMGCDVVCPVLPGVRLIEWDISDPKGKGTDVYRNVVEVIKDNLIRLMEEIKTFG